MTENRINGVSKEGLDKLVKEFYDFADRNNKIFNKINSIVEDSVNYFDTEEGDIFRKRFENIATESKTINKNILSYSSDFAAVKNNYIARATEGSDFLDEESKKIGKNDNKMEV